MTKPTWPVHPAKTQISLCTHAVWSVFTVAWRCLGSLAIIRVDSKGSDQTGQMPRLIWVFTGHTGNFLDFVMLQLKCKEFKHINSLTFKYVRLVLCSELSHLETSCRSDSSDSPFKIWILNVFSNSLCFNKAAQYKSLNCKLFKQNFAYNLFLTANFLLLLNSVLAMNTIYFEL